MRKGTKDKQRTKAAGLKITLIIFENYNWFQKLKTIRNEMKSLNTCEIRAFITQLNKAMGPVMISFKRLQKANRKKTKTQKRKFVRKRYRSRYDQNLSHFE